MRFHPYHLLGDTPNVVVDGSATPSTVLTLSHWPGSPTPEGLQDDLSAQIVVRAVEQDAVPPAVDAVTNNHFDQDGLAGVALLTLGDEAWRRRGQLVDQGQQRLAGVALLTLGDEAWRRRGQLVDLARAGDFGTFADRDSMRVAMALAAFDDPDRSPLDRAVFAGGYEAQCGALYEATLPRVLAMLDDPGTVRQWWEDEDAHLDASMHAMASGAATVDEVPELDLAVVAVPEATATGLASRFTITGAAALHPVAVNMATERMRVLVSQGNRHRLELRYETWVMYRSRPLMPRPDLRLLAPRLDDLEGRACWHADAPGALTPALEADEAGSTLPLPRIRAEVEAFLRTAAPAWDPWSPR